MEAAVGVHPALFVEEAGQPGAFFGQEAGVLLVDFQFLRSIPGGRCSSRRTRSRGAAGAQFGHAGQEKVHEAELGGLAFLGAGAGRQVQGNDRQVAEVGLQVAAFGIEFGVADAFDDASGVFRV
jgi:hypothetical protein